MHKNFWYIVVAACILALGTYYVLQYAEEPPANPTTWQAVFLSGGQAYFGHLKNYDKSFYLLSDVYYLQYASALQQENANTSVPAATPGSNLNLIKLGGELHGPENQMYIARSQVLFIENLRPDSRVVRAINNN